MLLRPFGAMNGCCGSSGTVSAFPTALRPTNFDAPAYPQPGAIGCGDERGITRSDPPTAKAAPINATIKRPRRRGGSAVRVSLMVRQNAPPRRRGRTVYAVHPTYR